MEFRIRAEEGAPGDGVSLYIVLSQQQVIEEISRAAIDETHIDQRIGDRRGRHRELGDDAELAQAAKDCVEELRVGFWRSVHDLAESCDDTEGEHLVDHQSVTERLATDAAHRQHAPDGKVEDVRQNFRRQPSGGTLLDDFSPRRPCPNREGARISFPHTTIRRHVEDQSRRALSLAEGGVSLASSDDLSLDSGGETHSFDDVRFAGGIDHGPRAMAHDMPVV